jgi:flap endonuclease-1
VKELQDMEALTGLKVAIDASMALYQFLVAVRTMGGGPGAGMLTNEAGEVTSHIQGMFNRTIKMMASGVKPLYVFDGKPPELKGGELAKRNARRAKAQEELELAKEQGDMEEVDRFSRRLVKVTRQHNEDCQELLRLMGVPFIIAPTEAESQCAALAKSGLVYATATEDMDALTFATPILLRRFTFSQSGKEKQPILEIDFSKVIRGLDLTYEQFVDLCILCGCDYCGTIKGIGPKTALKLIRLHKDLEGVIRALSKESKKYEIPSDWKVMRIPKVTKQDKGAEDADENDDDEEEEKERVEIIRNDHNEDIEKSENENILKRKFDEFQQQEHVVDNNNDGTIIHEDNEANNDEGNDAIVPTMDVVNDMKDALNESHVSSATNKTDKSNQSVESSPHKDSVDDIKTSTNEATEALDTDIEYEEVPPLFVQARKLFLDAEVLTVQSNDLKWTAPDEDGLRAFLVERMGFNLDRVNGGIKRLQEAQMKKSQMRMDR